MALKGGGWRNFQKRGYFLAEGEHDLKGGGWDPLANYDYRKNKCAKQNFVWYLIPEYAIHKKEILLTRLFNLGSYTFYATCMFSKCDARGIPSYFFLFSITT